MGTNNQSMRISVFLSKKTRVLIAITVLLIGLVADSCQKLNSCAHCTELESGYTPADFCGPEIAVDTYIEELENTEGQNWKCEKK